MRTVGIDYDSHAVHVAVFEDEVLHTFRYYISPEQSSLEILKALEAFLYTNVFNGCKLVVIESPIYIQNPKTAFALGRVYLLVSLACEKLKLVKVTLSNSRWKKLALGYAKLNKQQVFDKMKAVYGDIIADSHYADATGLASAGKKLVEGKNGA